MCHIQRWCLTICTLFIFLETIGGYSLKSLVNEKEVSRARGKGGGGKGGGRKGEGEKGAGKGVKKEKHKKEDEENINVNVNINVNGQVYENPDEPEKWATDIIKDKIIATSKLEDNEPGFDFSEEEMKKLKLWPGGVIPYIIDDFSFDKVLSNGIRTYLGVTNSITGLNFLELHSIPEDEKTRWVLFVNRQGLLGCADHSFKNLTTEGVQKVVLGYDCLSTGGELAEAILAIVGIPVQHNAPNRSKYITVVKENILPGKAYLFIAVQNNEWLFHDVDYDFSSASHYSLHKHTVNGMATIKPSVEVTATIGEGTHFSFSDILKIRMLYNYISKKSLKTQNLSKCNKLFKIGSNLTDYDPQLENKVKPRKKPNKYLGLPEKVTESKDSSAENTKSKKEKGIMKGIEGGKSKEGKESNIFFKEPVDSKEQKLSMGLENNNKKFEKRTKQGKLSANADTALLYISDFNTEEEFLSRHNQERIFTRPGG